MRLIDRWLRGAFHLALRTWSPHERDELGASMLDTFERRLRHAPPFAPARLVWGLREVVSAAWHGVRSRAQEAPGARAWWTGGADGGGWGTDARRALRTLMRHPGFTMLVVFTLGGGLGLVVSSFTVVENTLLEPLPFPDGGRLVALEFSRNGEGTRVATAGWVSWLDLVDLQGASRTLAALGGYTPPSSAALAGTDHPVLVDAVAVTPGFFETFSLEPERGRLFRDADHRTGGVAVLSHDTWVTRFGADPGILGRVVRVDDETVQIVGVLPPDARWFPSPDVELWLPYRPGGQSRGSRNLLAVGRLAPGVSIGGARSEIRGLWSDLARAYPEVDGDRSADLSPLVDRMMGAEAPRILELLLAATVVLLLLVCANVAGLQLARMSQRGHELAVQVSLGASRSRIVRPVVLETLLVSAAGGALATAMAAWLPGFVLSRVPEAVPRAGEVGLDAGAWVFAVALTLAAAVLSGLAPAWSVARRSLGASLAGGRTSSATVGGVRAREVLVVVQVAGAVALLASAGLLLRSVARLQRVDPGFDPRGVVSVSVRLGAAGYPDAAAVLALHDELLHALEELPRVAGVAAVSMLPFSGDNLCNSVAREGAPPPDSCTEYRSVTPGYFAVLGIPLLAGRDFGRGDGPGDPPVAVVSQAVAEALFPDGQARGRRIEGRGRSWEVVGVAGDVRMFGLAEPMTPTVYLSFRQAPSRLVTAVIRARGAAALAPSLPPVVWAADPSLAVRASGSLADLVSGSAEVHRFRGAMSTALGAVAALVALLGIAGLLYQLVQRQRREIGIRMALGSSATAVVISVLRRAAVLTFVGAGLGWALSLLAGRVLAGFLFGVTPDDPLSRLVASALIAAGALLAAAGPAVRAARVDPVRTLNQE